MKRLIIIVEGDTEKRFIDELLAPYLMKRGVNDTRCFKIKHSKGGLTKYRHLKTDILNCIYEENVIVSTMIDFYALPTDFPEYSFAKSIINKTHRVSVLEEAIRKDVEKEKGRELFNLLPYIQLHEFEALVFSSIKSFRKVYDDSEINFTELQRIIEVHSNPEDINDDPETAPSKRLKKLIKGYNKVIAGNLILEETGIEEIMARCPGFRGWVESLISRTI